MMHEGNRIDQAMTHKPDDDAEWLRQFIEAYEADLSPINIGKLQSIAARLQSQDGVREAVLCVAIEHTLTEAADLIEELCGALEDIARLARPQSYAAERATAALTKAGVR